MSDKSSLNEQGQVATLVGSDLKVHLKNYFGFDSFHAGQKEVIESVLEGKPTLAVMPTGAGKSLCYQLPALCLEGITLVISPLISLMKDQVDGLQAKGIGSGIINSAQTLEAQREVINELELGKLKLLYVAPERFQNEHFMRIVSKLNIALIAIDEAHCISKWGHNFRPHYARLGEYIADLNPPRVMACTATATPFVSEDIVKTLGFEDAHTHVAGFLRENLYLEARLCSSEQSRRDQLEAFLAHMLSEGEGAIVIYSTTIKRVEKYAQICADLLGADQVTLYHGKLSPKKREQAQERFMSGEARVVVATNAFGMGVDRADVRSVVHLDLPGTLEGYYQEVGRAGRDRKPAHCLLLYMLVDTRTHEFLISRSNPSIEHLQAVWLGIHEIVKAQTEQAPTIELLEQIFKRSDEPLDTAIRLFKSANLIRVDAWSETLELNPQWSQTEDVRALPLDLDTMEMQRFHELQNLETMLQFAQSANCRHTFLLQYFGEGAEGQCPKESHCDRCQDSKAAYHSAIEAKGPISEDERRVTIKALSGVARAKGIYGQSRVIEMLSGSTNSKLMKTFLKDLSTYGILKHIGSDDCKELINLMIGAGLCVLAQRILKNGEVAQYKSLQLTPTGLKVMQGKLDPPFRLKVTWVRKEKEHHQGRALRETLNQALRPRNTASRSKGAQSFNLDARTGKISPTKPSTAKVSGISNSTKTSNKQTANSNENKGLKEKLRRFRTSQARAREIPPFAVFSDAVLEQLLLVKPKNQSAFLAIKGLGPGKWANYGTAIIELIEES